jgi:acetophenone carboxylase
MFTIGIDMGGTFTDGYVTDGLRATVFKVPTTHFDLSRSVVGCLQRAAAGFGTDLPKLLADVDLLRIATTIGTNAVVEGTGDAVAVIVEPGAERALYGAAATSPAVGVFVDAEHVRGVPVGADPDELLRHCRELIAIGVRRVVVSLRHGHHRDERRVREVVTARYPEHYLRSIPLSVASELSSVPDDEIRTNTAILNAYVTRPMAKLLYRTEGLLQQEGLRVPVLAVRSDATAGRVARTTAIATYSSGPACGLSLVASLAGGYGDRVALGFDMGGTTLDLGLVVDGVHLVEHRPVVRGVPIALDVPRITSVGLGGSSIATAGPPVTVGPESAGAIPGPACFGRGGTAPTVTDADLVLGFLGPGDRFGDEIELVEAPARAALEIALGSPPVPAARQVRDAVGRQGAAVVRAVLAGAGIDAGAVVLYAFGGAGALHACGVAERAGIRAVRSFLFGSIFSACGVASSDLRQAVDAVVLDGEDVLATVDRLVRRARLDLEAELLDPDAAALTLSADTEAGERVIATPGTSPVDAVAAVPASERAAWRRLILRSTMATPPMPPVELAPFDGAGHRLVHWSGDPVDTPLLGPSALVDGAVVEGPALLHLGGVVHAVAPGWTARLHDPSSLLWGKR